MPMFIDCWTVVQLFLINFVFIISIFLISKIFLKMKFKDIKKSRLIFLIPLLFLLCLSSIFLNFKYQSIVYFFSIFIIIKLIFNKPLNDSIFVYLCIGLIYFSLSYLVTIIFTLKDELYLKNYLTRNIHYEIVLVSILSIIIAMPLKKLINKLHYKVKIRKENTAILFVIIDSLAFLLSICNLINNGVTIKNLIINFIIPLCILGCSFLFIRQLLERCELLEKYQFLEEYMENSSDLIEKYSSTIHKYKNNLITIKGYIKSNKESAIEYIDSLLGDYKKKNYTWLMKINRIMQDTIKYLVYYKLSKAEDLRLKMTIDISNEIRKVDYSVFKVNEIGFLTETLGEYFDNAIYASSESVEKELYFMIYLEDDLLVFLIGNTYKDKIDLKEIEDNGYTTKGKGHGLGLYEIAKSIKNRKKFDYSYEVLDNYFVTKLMVRVAFK